MDRITEVQKELSLKWKSLSSEDRKVENKIKYDEEARLLKLKYSEDLLEWVNGEGKKVQRRDSTMCEKVVKKKKRKRGKTAQIRYLIDDYTCTHISLFVFSIFSTT
ncbi:high mobility protein 4 [Plasmodium ovale curtisi]|uniref:High mobility protein 4 n=1 Tax=Plasmodium ovale curtisi TaxID=864141 RepID=A0A1A8W1I4_PLAOA|nr:high mobility protein 4 [Plasmodium ovale curtisi]